MGGSEMQKSNTVWSITEINEYIRMVLESQMSLQNIWLRGEISNFKQHYKSGHCYFLVKDEMSALRAVMFRGANAALTFTPQDGMKVILRGKIVSYPRDGQTQVVVAEMLPDGAGSQALAFEQLRKRLEAEGLFADERKKALPGYPRSIGVVTSPNGAAIHDIIRITGRRYPSAQIILYPALVQGEGAPLSLRAGVSFFNSVPGLVDVIILGRGGGSAEDLWAFNDEALARCVAASDLPIISAVGHESDVTICDFVADARASTPSAAAEMSVPDGADLLRLLSARADSLYHHMKRRLTLLEEMVKTRSMHRLLRSPEALLDLQLLHLCHREERLQSLLSREMDTKGAELARRVAALQGRDPLALLARGYAVVTDQNDVTKTSAASFAVGEDAVLRFADGTVHATVNAVHTDTHAGISREEADHG